MVRLSQDQIDQILARDKPGYRIVEPEPDEPEAVVVDAGLATVARAPDLAILRQMYFGEDSDESEAAAEADAAEEDDDDEILLVEPGQVGGGIVGVTPKTVIISAREGRVIAEQG